MFLMCKNYLDFLFSTAITYTTKYSSAMFKFWLQVAARAGMPVTLHLILLNVYNSVKAPENRGFSYIEVWMFGAHFPICLALFEYGFILFLKKTAKKLPDKFGMTEDEKIKRLDFFTILFSFCFFVLFNLIYWTILSL